MDDTTALLALNMTRGIGPVRLRRLLHKFGSPQAILTASPAALQSVEGIGPDTAAAIAAMRTSPEPQKETELAAKHGIRILPCTAPEFPEALRPLPDAPIVLYAKGPLRFGQREAIAVVGTRKPSYYGAECAKKLSFQLATAGLVIVSGLAHGVDTLAHQAALAAKGRTTAVLGSGLLAIYPRDNIPLAEKIISSGGLLLSEFPLRTPADRQTFPMRNRIVSALSFGILVIEAGHRSGALITASQAAEQGRALYAVPGRIDNPSAAGTNRLIQQGAKLVTSAADILDDFGILFTEKPKLSPPPLPHDLTDHERAILSCLAQEPRSLDEICAQTQLPSHLATSTLLALEIRRLVKTLPGARFTRLI